MVGELVKFPFRVGARVTQLWLETTGEAVGLAITAADRVLGRRRAQPVEPRPTRGADTPPPTGSRRRAQPREDRPAPPVEEPEAPSAEERPAPPSTPATPPAAPSAQVEIEPEPLHVSESPELVEELAEPGAEDGAGAQIRIQEPWEGYDHAHADEVINRLDTASREELAAIQLYESTNRSRQTVLAAVERELRAASGRGSSTR